MKQFLIALDQLLNTAMFFLPGKAWADETISARCWRCRDKQPYATMRAVIDGLFFLQCDHCRKAFESERKRMQSPPEVRT